MSQIESTRANQELLLSILLDEAPHPLRGRTFLQKLTFLVQQKADFQAFHFDAGEYGPFSRQLYHVVEYLIENDYMTEREVEDDNGIVRYEYEAGPWVDQVFGHANHDELRKATRAVIDEYPTDELQPLIEQIYTEYPAMARNSVY